MATAGEESPSSTQKTPPLRRYPGGKDGPPSPSSGVLSDIRAYFLARPEIRTRVRFKSASERQEYNQRIMQRLGITVSEYSVLDIHRIGIEVPNRYVFEELTRWNGDGTCWPNHVAMASLVDGCNQNVHIHLMGWTRYPFGCKGSFLGLKYIPLFDLNAIHYQPVPSPMDVDSARYMLYGCSGGYPIGIFAIYVRSSIPEEGEKEQTQLFMIVGFNFYGKARSRRGRLMGKPWEWVHDRVTANVLNRIKRLCEWKFARIQQGRPRRRD